MPTPLPDRTNAINELAVAAVLWDLYDDSAEPWDRLADGLAGIFSVTASLDVPTFGLFDFQGWPAVDAFWAAWKAWRLETICEAGRIFTAHFIPHGPYSLTVHAAPPEGGTARVVAGRACADGAYPEGEEVRLQAQPRPGSAFAGWIGADATDPDDIAVVTMTNPGSSPPPSGSSPRPPQLPPLLLPAVCG